MTYQNNPIICRVACFEFYRAGSSSLIPTVGQLVRRKNSKYVAPQEPALFPLCTLAQNSPERQLGIHTICPKAGTLSMRVTVRVNKHHSKIFLSRHICVSLRPNSELNAEESQRIVIMDTEKSKGFLLISFIKKNSEEYSSVFKDCCCMVEKAPRWWQTAVFFVLSFAEILYLLFPPKHAQPQWASQRPT